MHDGAEQSVSEDDSPGEQRVRRVDIDSILQFSCHCGVPCFTECCRMLELALTPYDVLRLRKATGMTSMQLLEEAIIIEQDPGEPFPRFYLTMVDDGRASCIFVREQGCAVYQDRPGACRAYPLGRAATHTENGGITEYFVIVQEKHCLGFAENHQQTVREYREQQGLAAYNRFNDEVARILQHKAVREGFIPSARQISSFTLALYNLDLFREQLFAGRLPGSSLKIEEQSIFQDDEKLLLWAIGWLKDQLFVL